MSDTITLVGLVATTPRHIKTSEGLSITSFRLASSQRRYDRSQHRWVDGDTNWYTVSTFRALATNAAASLGKGDRVMVTGRLRIRDWQDTDRSGTTVEIEAETMGHDLFWGTSAFTRVPHNMPHDDDAGPSQDAESTPDSASGDGDGWASVA